MFNSRIIVICAHAIMMILNRLRRSIGADPKVATVNIFLVVNAFVWYASSNVFLVHFVGETKSLSIAGVNFLGVGVMALVGSALISKYQQRLTFLRYWIFAGIPLSITPFVISTGNFPILLITSFTLGAYFGIGLPVCMGYFSANTETETRARIGGLAVLMIGVGSFVLPILGGTDAIITSFLLALWRTTCLVVLFFIKPIEGKIEQKDFLSYRAVVLNRSFLLYFIPWIMFTLVNDLTYPLYQESLKAFPLLVENGTIIESVLVGVFSVVYGFAADRIGRKRVILLAFALLGVGYGALGFGPGNELVFWFYTAVDSIAWGALSMIFIMTVWGDLAQTKGSEKFYVLGSLPYLLSNISRLTIGKYLADTVPGAAVFSFAGFFLFAAVLPLFLAPETLPEKIIKDNEMKTYLEKAQKIVMKTQNEDGKKPLKGYEEIKLKIEIRQEEFEKSEELAEECY